MAEISNDLMCNYEMGIVSLVLRGFGGINAYFSEMRIPMKEIPEGCFKYDIRGRDKDGSWACVEHSVGFNHVATIITDTEIPMTTHANEWEWTDILSYNILSRWDDED